MWVSYAVGTGGEYTFERRWAPGEPPPWSLSSGRPPPQPLTNARRRRRPPPALCHRPRGPYWLSICSCRSAMLPCSSRRFSREADCAGSSFFIQKGGRRAGWRAKSREASSACSCQPHSPAGPCPEWGAGVVKAKSRIKATQPGSLHLQGTLLAPHCRAWSNTPLEV